MICANVPAPRARDYAKANHGQSVTARGSIHGRFVAALVLFGAARAEEPPALEAEVKAGTLPPLAQRLPHPPLVVDVKRKDWTEGVYGGEMRMLMAKDRDIRMMVVYGYSRLVGYDEQLKHPSRHSREGRR